MKKEFGKWLLDVGKYMTTAVILTSLFGDVTNGFYTLLPAYRYLYVW
jgi:hypothetical protein